MFLRTRAGGVRVTLKPHPHLPHVGDLAQGVLGAHLGLHIGRRPHEGTLVHLVAHQRVKFGLGA